MKNIFSGNYDYKVIEIPKKANKNVKQFQTHFGNEKEVVVCFGDYE